MTPTDASPNALTVIIPARCSPERLDVIERLNYVNHDDRRPESVKILVVDDGSTAGTARRLKSTCHRLGFDYHRIDSELQHFSIGRARNVGTQVARTPFVMFLDADLMPYPGFFQDVLNEITVQELNKFSERFLMFGVIYLTEQATNEYLHTPQSLRRSQFIQHFLNADRSRVEKFSTGTSVTVWNRAYFLGAGGNDPDFEGWGYEDLEFACRAIRREKRFPLPEEFGLDYRNFQTINEYRGWKSVYRLFGDTTFQKGMALFHAWHPVETKSAYAAAKTRNRQLFERKQKQFALTGEEAEPLPMPECGRTLMFRSNPWTYNRWVVPYLGEVTIIDEDMLTVAEFSRFVKERRIDRVLFHNPYANEQMLALYQWVRESGTPFLVCERGALPGSVFFDPSGFNGESASYQPDRWRRPLSPDEERAINEYICQTRTDKETLEEQPERIGPQAQRKALRISPKRKILFVPLQRPSDTVIQYLCDPIGSYDNFLTLIKRLTHSLPPDWLIVAKRHPLETQTPDLPSVIFAEQGHIDDLVEMSDAVLLINSGVGLTALMYEKPLLYAGSAFFGHEGLAKQVTSHDEVIKALSSFRPSRQAIKQFLHYLVFEFYSFANFKTRRVAWTDGALMTATQRIDYKVLRLPRHEEFRMGQRSSVAVTHDSVLFDRYRHPSGKVTGAAAIGVKATPGPSAAKLASSQSNGSVSPGGIPPQSIRASSQQQRPAALRKLKKLRENPIMFLRDSQYGVFRSIGHSISSH